MRAYMARIGELQSEIVLGLTYLVVVFPIWLILRCTGHRLIELEPRWHQRATPQSLDELRLPF